jgi:hypothetical protein
VIPGCQSVAILRLITILARQRQEQTLTLFALIEVSAFICRELLILFDYVYPPWQR